MYSIARVWFLWGGGGGGVYFGFLFRCWVFALFCFYYLCSLNSRSDELKREGTTSGQIVCSCTAVSHR